MGGRIGLQVDHVRPLVAAGYGVVVVVRALRSADDVLPPLPDPVARRHLDDVRGRADARVAGDILALDILNGLQRYG
jgi:hypothetical protein